MQKRYLLPMVFLSLLILTFFVQPVFAAPPTTMRVGLSFGKDAWKEATFSSQQGLTVGFDLSKMPLMTFTANDQVTVVGDGFGLEVGQYASITEAQRTMAALKAVKIDAMAYHLSAGKWSVRVGQAISPDGLTPLKALLKQNGYAQWKDIGAFRLQLEESYATQAEAAQRTAAVKAGGLPAYLAYDGGWRVWVGDHQASQLDQLQASVAALLPGVKTTTISPDINRVVLLNGQYDPVLIFSAQRTPTFAAAAVMQRADNYRVEIGKYNDLLAANQVRQQINELGYSAYLYKHEEGGQSLFSILVGDAWESGTAQALGAQLTAKGYPVVRYTGPFHLVSFASSSSLSAMTAKVNDLRGRKIEATLYYDNGWRIAVGQAASEQELEGLRTRLAALYPLDPYVVTEIDGGRMQVFDDSGRILGFYQVPPERMDSLKVWTVDGGSILLSEKNGSYPGLFEIRRYYHGGITVINQVSMDDYVAGVVAQEMYPSWPVEALKAQAVAARSYAVRRVGSASLSQWGCDVDATTSTQAYTNLDKARLPNVQKAVRETSGQYAWYDGSIADTYFHSDSGGYTENSENVWTAALPYLRGVPELFPDESPYAAWQKTFTLEEVGSRVKSAGFGDVGMVTDIVVDTVGVSGRPVALRIVGTAGQVTLKNEQPRSVFGLLSNNFTIGRPGGASVYARGVESTPTIVALPQAVVLGAAGKQAISQPSGTVVRGSDQTTTITGGLTTDKFTIYGKGFGHGLGLSQWGAKSMADHGYTYIQILQHYYKDIVIQ